MCVILMLYFNHKHNHLYIISLTLFAMRFIFNLRIFNIDICLFVPICCYPKICDLIGNRSSETLRLQNSHIHIIFGWPTKPFCMLIYLSCCLSTIGKIEFDSSLSFTWDTSLWMRWLNNWIVDFYCPAFYIL